MEGEFRTGADVYCCLGALVYTLSAACCEDHPGPSYTTGKVGGAVTLVT